MYKSNHILVVLLILLFLSILQSEVLTAVYEEDTTLKLKECVEKSFSENRTVSITNCELDLAGARVKSMRSVFFPQFVMETTFSRIDRLSNFLIPLGPVPKRITIGTHDSFAADLLLQYPIFNWGKNRDAYSLAEESKELTREQTIEKRRNLYDRTIRAFYLLLLRQESEKVQTVFVQKAEELEEIARARYEAGVVVKLDLLNASLHLTETQSRLEAAHEAKKRARMTLNQLMGSELNFPVVVEGTFCVHKPVDNSESLVRSAFQERNELRSLEIHENMSVTRMRTANNALRPDVHIIAGYNIRNGYMPDVNKTLSNWNAGIGITFPLFNGMFSHYEAQQEKINQKIISLQKSEIQEQITLEIEEILSRMSELTTSLEYNRQSIRQAEEAFRVALTQYEYGVVSMTDVLNAESAMLRIKLKNLQDKFQYTIASYDLEKAAGCYPSIVTSAAGGGK